MTFDPTTPPPYSVKSLAERWECSESMIRKLIKNGALRHFTIGKMVRIPQASVEDYEAGAAKLAAAVSYVADASGRLAEETAEKPIRAVRQIGRKPRARKPLDQ
ncbi:MAG: hypothetical protein COC10_08170 [Sphingobium sp.]|nr:MAG: hypothetical protein COC10_08170 [Sphingobium sp.]